jgi:hypothetical protein
MNRIFFWLIFLVASNPSSLDVQGAVGAVPVPPEPLERNTDALAAHLEAVRWRCSGKGCLDQSDIDRLASEIFSHSVNLDLDVGLLVGILMVENPWLDSLAVSSAGAVGLYQVMPMHREAWTHCDGSLETVSGSVCHGSFIIHDFLNRKEDTNRALLAYNGCRGGPCEVYPKKVFGYLNQFSTQDEP